ncbi:RNA polymerase subunit sigma-24 [Dyadobacter sp. CY345]|uniref:RNA polymerase sigma factor n=1 Tax=Dyadobacter sp. CY345 TaxID=2909335 RepID=UPI001F24765A|nr:sigma factor [Dyadobacter sp. CY345]MCF2445903.1 RNA polymerase subunit sigma-24 [Dyadobacter sp. CY345]
MNFPNEQILFRVSQGDEVAFSQLRTHFQSPALKFCKTLLKDDQEAENITKDVFAKIWDSRVQIKPEVSFQTYLFVNLRNQIFEQFQKFEKDQILRQQYLDKVV